MRKCVISLACVLISFNSRAQTSKPSAKEPGSQRQEDAFQKHFDTARTFQIAGDREHAATEYKKFLAEVRQRWANHHSL